MPLGSDFAYPSTSGESVDRVSGVGAELAQARVLRLRSLRWSCADLVCRLRPPLGLTRLVRSPRMRKRTIVTVLASPAVDKTYDRLINYVYDRYSESRPLSDPPTPPRCAFEDYFTVSDPQAVSRPKLCVYPRVDELVAQSQDRAAKLAWESKQLHRVIPLRRRLFPVADYPDYATPWWLIRILQG